ncbi:GDSL-type esterase/lipase family protein [Caldisalinibacter kiritimatiensis]|uniref:Lipase/Acylhydrolase n=1 Tax=Caldisalinibacter kiritimatiensis TaxID=1304284 RepID=R1CPK0_9FIRM|nr:GDSL-type esterase/lipase family protein [Caldisalinibacter kiritimatiensis]EOD00591.1 Lipase/Acylhydrolase [Caldisalinibacter kiritimatiensis]
MQKIWYGILFIFIISISIFSYGIKSSLIITESWPRDKITNSKEQPYSLTEDTIKVIQNKDQISILVLGDSLARGTGDETGYGFTGHFANYLEQNTNKKVNVIKAAINGQLSSELLSQINQQNVSQLVKNSDVIIISTGGNDILKNFHSVESINETLFYEVEDRYLKNLTSILNNINSINPNAYMIFLGLYNPLDLNKIKKQHLNLLLEWNYKTKLLVESYQNSTFIPSYDLFKYNRDKYISIDDIHPNSKGYKAIADRIIKIIGNILTKK